MTEKYSKIISMETYNYYFYGLESYAYKLFGAHKLSDGYYRFSLWAPNALNVQVIGSFNDWSCQDGYLHKVDQRGVWEVDMPARQGDYYKFRVTQVDGVVVDKIDPYAFESELRPNTASRIVDDDYVWNDEKWMKERSKNFDRPMNIYECHAGAFKIHDGNVTYDTIADDLIPYLKENHYTHVEFMPLSEYPFDGSWGYQVSGYFCTTSRYGTCNQLKSLIDRLHQAGIGVIYDFVPVHFVSDNYALRKYDGTCCYEYENSTSQWGTSNFDLGKNEVRSFLTSCANYWLQQMHGDGLRMDAISNLIYYDGNKNKGTNDGGIQFIQNLNIAMNQLNPTAMLIAEDSTDYPNVTKPVSEHGLGFDYKWDLGWMNDTLSYFKRDPIYRQYHHNNITFSMAYFYSERFILEFSHDEVVHGKATIVNKMWGSYEQKFAQARALYLYMMTHPGKKLNFMGNELGMLREFDEKQENDWMLLQYPMHQGFANYIKKLNEIYLSHPCLYENDYSYDSYEWIDADDNTNNIFSYVRYSKDECLVSIINASTNNYDKFKVEVPFSGQYSEILNSDDTIYGGNGLLNNSILKAEADEHNHKFKYAIFATIPAFSAILLRVSTKNKRKEYVTTINSK